MVTGKKPKEQRNKAEAVMATPGKQKVLDRRATRGGGRHPSGPMTGSGKVKSASGGSEGVIASHTSDVSGETRRPIGRAAAKRAIPYKGDSSSAQGKVGLPKGKVAPAPNVETRANTRNSGRAAVVSGKAGAESKSAPPGKAERQMPKAAPAKGKPRGKSKG